MVPNVSHVNGVTSGSLLLNVSDGVLFAPLMCCLNTIRYITAYYIIRFKIKFDWYLKNIVIYNRMVQCPCRLGFNNSLVVSK